MNYESEYDNRARVPEHPAILAGWARDAADAWDVLHPQLELPYGPDPRQAFDFFHPSGESGATILFVHGGYWRAFDKNAFSHMARGLVAHSLAVAIPSFRLCPSVRVGDIIDDVRSCARRVHAMTGRRLVIVGHSAGG